MQKESDSSTLICTGDHPEKSLLKNYAMTPDLPKHYREECNPLP